MRNYWYISLLNRYPQPSRDDPPCIVLSVQINAKYSIIEMVREATPIEIDGCKLRYCGHGVWNDENIQRNIRRYVK
ncbi:hypothetical protein EMQU_0787 [Enterococcus mundtii QU 25]|uniref:hypothetical protein n=1 Tax=Enterococcus mundtii TaxID=53346 RepID=UPI0003C54A17|nr:hypothetical protein [Enterococcus mundtii]BAO06344.1 hypothetical protein EMQU_0787 [Enterococcus mundtii QU 25]